VAKPSADTLSQVMGPKDTTFEGYTADEWKQGARFGVFQIFVANLYRRQGLGLALGKKVLSDYKNSAPVKQLLFGLEEANTMKPILAYAKTLGFKTSASLGMWWQEFLP